jgi:hypothetical protein
MDSNDSQSSIVHFTLAVAALFGVAGSPISGYFLTKIFLEARASASWPSVSGTVTKAQVGSAGFGRYFADVSYIYHIGGNDLTGTRVRASDGEYDGRDGAIQAIRGLSVGQTVLVFYDPSDPRQAVLRPGASFQEYALLVIPLLMFGSGLGVFCFLWWTRRRS